MFMEWIWTSKKKNAIKDNRLNENLDTIMGGVNSDFFVLNF